MRNAKSLSLVVLMAASSCGKATQPKPQCKAQQEEYAARYFEVDGSRMGMCTDDDVLEGEPLFLQYYKTDPVSGTPKIAIEPASFADAIAVGEEHKVDVKAEPEYSIGTFKDVFPDDNDVCVAPKLEDSSLEVAEVPADPANMVEGVPAVSLKYKWSNLKMLTKPLSNAIHFGADLERTSGACTIKYKVSAIYPVIHCGNGTKPVLDDMGNPIPGMTEPDPESGDPDPAACEPSEVGAAHGSGLSPELTYECNKATLMCLPTKAFPAYKK
ncbi:MAG TPA: hypothetical protein VN914_12230 [Polyangia bacterium]|nr:hypothetical protein [Polyangia bacterium]